MEQSLRPKPDDEDDDYDQDGWWYGNLHVVT
jgi:hypothetical protein